MKHSANPMTVLLLGLSGLLVACSSVAIDKGLTETASSLCLQSAGLLIPVTGSGFPY